MGKYEPLARYLEKLPRDSLKASFTEIEEILDFKLPPSAYNHFSWWGNSTKDRSQARGWMDAGWQVVGANLSEQVVTLRRSSSDPATSEMQELWNKAREISGIEDPQELERAAVTCFIHREAGRQLAEMGGTMPDFEVPPRRRITW